MMSIYKPAKSISCSLNYYDWFSLFYIPVRLLDDFIPPASEFGS